MGMGENRTVGLETLGMQQYPRSHRVESLSGNRLKLTRSKGGSCDFAAATNMRVTGRPNRATDLLLSNTKGIHDCDICESQRNECKVEPRLLSRL